LNLVISRFSLAVFLDEAADAIAAFAGAFGALNAEHVEPAFDVAKDEISPPRHDGDITTGLAVGDGAILIIVPQIICGLAR
jgi:hypothetical protein